MLHQDAVRIENVGETYQRMVDSAFKSQLGRNLEAYVDDMVMKRNDEKMMLIALTKHLTTLGEST